MLLQVCKIDCSLLLFPLSFDFGSVEPTFSVWNQVVYVGVTQSLILYLNSIFFLLLLRVDPRDRCTDDERLFRFLEKLADQMLSCIVDRSVHCSELPWVHRASCLQPLFVPSLFVDTANLEPRLHLLLVLLKQEFFNVTNDMAWIPNASGF